jgi:hypothetical protein
MRPLLVTAFFDIGRGNWEKDRRSTRSVSGYVTSFKRYLALLPAEKYILSSEGMRSTVAGFVDYFDATSFAETSAHRFLDQTRAVMESEEFTALLRVGGKPEHTNPECRIPEYNVVMLTKWDALDRAFALTAGKYSHYIWVDFGLGHRAKKRPSLPLPEGLSPIERDRIVVSAERKWALPDLRRESLADQIQNPREQVGGSVLIVPAHLVSEFGGLVRSSYQMLLDMGLTADDQVALDMCVYRRPELFHLSFPPLGLTKFNNAHNILNGRDGTQPWEWPNWAWPDLAFRLSQPVARARLGIPVHLRLLLR